MSRAQPINKLLSLNRRPFAAAAGAEVQHRAQVAARISGAAAEDGVNTVAAAAKEIFWMRDPKTAYWIPENRFTDVVDAAELRAQLLSRKD